MPSAVVHFHRLATQEYLKAYDRYALISPELGDSFKAEIDKAVKKVADDPGRWPEFGRTFRWVKTRKFPYILYFQVSENSVDVLAVAHGRRRLRYWKKRRYN